MPHPNWTHTCRKTGRTKRDWKPRSSDPGGRRPARPQQDLNMKAGSGDHVHERIETEAFDPAAHEIADPRLRHAEEGCRLALGQFFGFHEFLQPKRQEGAQLERDGFLSGEPNVLEHVAARWFDG